MKTFFALILFCSTSAFAATADLKLPVPEIETLTNGMKIAWFLNDRLPVVDIALLVQSGYRDDPRGKSGTAQLLAAALDRGAGGMSSDELARAVELLGAQRYSAIEEDSLSLGIHGLALDAQTLLNLLSKSALQPQFNEQEVAREKLRLIDQWSHVGDSTETLATLAAFRQVSSGTSYGRGSFLSVAEFRDRVSRDDAIAFYRRHVVPANSVLMVVGRVNKAEFRAQIVALFGGWKGALPAREYENYADPRVRVTPGEVLVIDRPGANQAQVRIDLRSPPIQSSDHYALAVGNALLGEYFNSRLNTVIRDQLGLTYSIASQFSYSRDFAVFGIGSATQTESIGKLLLKTDELVRNLATQPIEAAEVATAKEYLVGGFPLNYSTLGAVAARWLAGYILNLGPGYLNEFIPKVRSVQAPDVSKAMAKLLPKSLLKSASIAVSGDAAEIEKQLKASGIRYRRISVKDLM